MILWSRGRVKLMFLWYDLWIGAYYDRLSGIWYFAIFTIVLEILPKQDKLGIWNEK